MATAYEVRVRSASAAQSSGSEARTADADFESIKLVTDLSSLAYAVGGLTANTSYRFDVRAVVDNATTINAVSAWSDAASATTLTVPSLPAPTGLRAVETTNRLDWYWNAVTGADAYDIEWSNGELSVSSDGIGQRRIGVLGISIGVEYVFSVRAVNATTGATSSWATVRITPDGTPGTVRPPPTTAPTTPPTTELPPELPPPPPTTGSTTSTTELPPPPTTQPPGTLTGKVAIMRMPPTPVGSHTLSLAFYTSGGTQVLPRLRFLPFSGLDIAWQYTSPVELTVNGQATDVGRVAYRKTTNTGDRIELGFLPTGASSVVLPTVRKKDYSDMTNYTWYKSSTFSYTVTAGSRARSDSDPRFAGRVASEASPGDNVCEGCYTTTADLEP